MPEATTQDGPPIRPFADFLLEHSGGRTAAELSEKLHELVASIRDTGKKGTLTFTLNIEPMKNDTDTLVVVADVVAKAPRQDRKGSVFFPDADGNLRRNDPRQAHLPLKGLPGTDDDAPEQLKEVQA